MNKIKDELLEKIESSIWKGWKMEELRKVVDGRIGKEEEIIRDDLEKELEDVWGQLVVIREEFGDRVIIGRKAKENWKRLELELEDVRERLESFDLRMSELDEAERVLRMMEDVALMKALDENDEEGWKDVGDFLEYKGLEVDEVEEVMDKLEAGYVSDMLEGFEDIYDMWENEDL